MQLNWSGMNWLWSLRVLHLLLSTHYRIYFRHVDYPLPSLLWLWLDLRRLWHRLLVVLLLLLLLMCVLRHLLRMHLLRRRTWLYGLLMMLERRYRLLLWHSLLRLRG